MGPYKLLAIQNETATIQLPRGPSRFRTTSIKRYDRPEQLSDPDDPPESLQDNLQDNVHTDESIQDEPTLDDSIQSQWRNPTCNRQLPSRFRDTEPSLSIYLADNLQPSFVTSRQKELDGLIMRGVFGFINIDQVPTSARIFNS